MGGRGTNARWLGSLFLAGVISLVPFSAGSAAATVTDSCGKLAGPPLTYSHVVVIMEENLSYPDAIGNTDAPYLNVLASDCALATNFHNETHPSQPNYMAATSGYATGVGVHSSNPSSVGCSSSVFLTVFSPAPTPPSVFGAPISFAVRHFPSVSSFAISAS